jgi:hypothetical protein
MTTHPTDPVLDLSLYFDNVTEAAAAYGISAKTLHDRIRDGKVKSIKLGWARLVAKPETPRS